MADSFVSAPNAGTNGGFFGNITAGLGSGIGDALGSIARDILPVWTAKQLNVQRSDQLNSPTFNSNFAGNRVNGYGNTTAGMPVQASTVGLLFDNIKVSGTALLGVAVAIVVGIAMAKMA